jgi:hypothetical protein
VNSFVIRSAESKEKLVENSVYKMKILYVDNERKRVYFSKNEYEKEQNDNTVNNLTIFPGKEWIVCLGVIVPDILNKFELKKLKVNYEYKKLNGIKTFKENTEIDFEQYSRFLVYISEIDELKQVNEKIERTSKNIEKRLKNIETSIVQYHNIEDTFLKTVANIESGINPNNNTKSKYKGITALNYNTYGNKVFDPYFSLKTTAQNFKRYEKGGFFTVDFNIINAFFIAHDFNSKLVLF